jgi:phospholipid/cholesterol/gamma-HCH transport system ATP-binding protein
MKMDFCAVASPVIEFENVDLAFGSQRVFDGANLKVLQGQCLTLVGPSGQGKTSALKLIAGLLTPQGGRVLIEGKDLAQLSPAEAQKIFLRMGMLFQKNALFDSMSVMENLLFPLREVTNLPPAERREIAESLLEAVELSAAKHLFPHEISGGMQKRLGIARALALKPKVVLYDDPTAGLDPITSRKIAALLKNLSEKEKVTTVVITNDMMRAFQLADQIGFVWNQKITAVGPPEEAKLSPQEPFRSFMKGLSFA